MNTNTWLVDLVIFRQPILKYAMIIKAVDLPSGNEKLKLLCCEDPLFLNISTVLSSDC